MGGSANEVVGAVRMLPLRTPTLPPATHTNSFLVGAGRAILVEPATPYKIKGISWSPTGIGQVNEGGYAGYYTQWRSQDVPFIQNLNANTVKTYDAFERNGNGIALLDDLYSRGIMVIMSVVLVHNAGKAYLDTVNYFKNHPAILMWVVGNEFNYNNMYGAPNYGAALAVVNTAINDIKAADPDHPVAVSYGELPSQQQYAEIPNADIWSINIYPGLQFGSRFNTWLNMSEKPMFIGEYGADAFNTQTGQEDQAAQAHATQVLTEQIMLWYSANNADLPVLGGTPYSLTDEWWKAEGSASEHNTGGFENAIHPDNYANEEWWGLLTIQRGTRQAYNTLKNLYAE